MSRLFTAEEIKQLSHLESYFQTATQLNYKRNTSLADNQLVLSMLEQATGLKMTKNLRCPKCVMDIYKQTGTIYFNSKKALEEAAQTVVDVLDELTAEETTEEEVADQNKEEATVEPAKKQRKTTIKRKASAKKTKTNK